MHDERRKRLHVQAGNSALGFADQALVGVPVDVRPRPIEAADLENLANILALQRLVPFARQTVGYAAVQRK